MLKFYKCTLPSPEVATRQAVKLEGMGSRLLNFLTGIEFGIGLTAPSVRFFVVASTALRETSGYVTVATDSPLIIDNIRKRFEDGYGVTIDTVKP